MGIRPSQHIDFLESSLTFRLNCGRCMNCDPDFKVGWGAVPFVTIVVILKGQLYCYRGCKCNAKKAHIKQGQAFVVPSGIPHSWGVESDGVSIAKADFQARLLNCVDICDLYKLPFVLDEPDSTILKNAILEMKTSYARQASDDILSMVTRKKNGLVILETLLRHAQEKCNRAGRLSVTTERLLPVFRHIHDNLNEEMNREGLARLVSLSPSRFNGLFKECTGQAPMSYVKQARLRESQRLLSTTDLPIGEIANRLRFYDAFHFSRQFKKTFEISPRDYRKDARKTLI